MVPMGLVGMSLLHTIKDWKDGKGFVLPWVEQEEQRDVNTATWVPEWQMRQSGEYLDEELAKIDAEYESKIPKDISYLLDSNSVQFVLWYYLHTVRGN